MKVYVCFSASDKWYAKAIRALTKSKVNHTYIVLEDSEVFPEPMALEIDTRGVVITTQKNVEGSANLIEHYECTSVDLYPAVKANFNLLGSKYDFLGIFGFLIKCLAWNWFKWPIKNPIHKDGELFCSETVAKILKTAQIPWAKSLDPASVSPKMLRQMILERTDKDWKLTKIKKV